MINGSELMRKKPCPQLPWFYTQTKHFEKVKSGNRGCHKRKTLCKPRCDWCSFRKPKLFVIFVALLETEHPNQGTIRCSLLCWKQSDSSNHCPSEKSRGQSGASAVDIWGRVLKAGGNICWREMSVDLSSSMEESVHTIHQADVLYAKDIYLLNSHKTAGVHLLKESSAN